MKITSIRLAIAAAFAFSMFAVSSAHAQAAPVLQNNPQVLQMQANPQHASQHAMAQESSLLNTWTYTYAKGELPLAEVGSLPQQLPLGDVARAYRKEHVNAPKAVMKLEK